MRTIFGEEHESMLDKVSWHLPSALLLVVGILFWGYVAFQGWLLVTTVLYIVFLCLEELV
jgi:hypothetical protein